MADSDLVNEELERVYRLFGERTRQFRRGLYGLIVASLAIFVLIVVPFLTFRDQLAEMQATEAELAVALQQARDLVADTGASLKEMRAIRTAADDFARTYQEWQLYQDMEREAAEHTQVLEDLRRSFSGTKEEGMAAWVQGTAKQPPQAFIQTNRQLFGVDQIPCYWESGTGHVSCQVCEAFTREHKRLDWRISRLVAVDEAVRGAARDDLGTLVERSCGWLTRGEEHWRTGERLSSVDPAELRGWFAHDLMAYLERIAELDGALQKSLPERELAMERIARARVETTERLAVLQEQLGRIASFDRLGTPVGDLPVGLGQIVLLFPVVLALGFLVVANGYARTAELRRAFVRLCRKRDPTGEVMDDRHVSAIAPLWLDRGEPLGARAAKWAIMLTPLALMLANLVLIATTRALTAQLPDDAAIPPLAYLVLYAASLALFAGALWHVRRSGDEPLDTETAIPPKEP
jgi:hypothetical protein